MTFENKAYEGYTPYPEVIWIALSYFLAKENHDILIEEWEDIRMSFSAMINWIESLGVNNIIHTAYSLLRTDG